MTIKLNQNVDRLKILYKGILQELDSLGDYMLRNLVDEIKVGELYCCYELNDNAIIGDHNIYITEINKVSDDYEIKGIGLEDEEVILKFSTTEFWYQ